MSHTCLSLTWNYIKFPIMSLAKQCVLLFYVFIMCSALKEYPDMRVNHGIVSIHKDNIEFFFCVVQFNINLDIRLQMV